MKYKHINTFSTTVAVYMNDDHSLFTFNDNQVNTTLQHVITYT